jgi:hypothetical protein
MSPRRPWECWESLPVTTLSLFLIPVHRLQRYRPTSNKQVRALPNITSLIPSYTRAQYGVEFVRPLGTSEGKKTVTGVY